MVLLAIFVLFIVEKTLNLNSDFWKIFCTSSITLFCLHYSANLKAMTSVPFCPRLPFKDVASMANAIENEGFKLVTAVPILRQVENIRSHAKAFNAFKQLDLALRSPHKVIFAKNIAESCEIVAEGDGSGLAILFKSLLLASCQNHSDRLQEIVLKDWPTSWMGFLARRNSRKLTECVSFNANLLKGSYESVYLEEPNVPGPSQTEETLPGCSLKLARSAAYILMKNLWFACGIFLLGVLGSIGLICMEKTLCFEELVTCLYAKYFRNS